MSLATFCLIFVSIVKIITDHCWHVTSGFNNSLFSSLWQESEQDPERRKVSHSDNILLSKQEASKSISSMECKHSPVILSALLSYFPTNSPVPIFIHVGGARHCESKVFCPRIQQNVRGQGSKSDRSLVQRANHWFTASPISVYLTLEGALQANLCLCHCLHFSSFAHRRHHARHELTTNI